MKIAYIGNFEPEYSTENDVRKAFEYVGHEVIKFQENKITPQRVHPETYTYDLLLITSTWDSALDLKEMLTVFKECARRNIPTATLHLDTFWGTSRGGRAWWLNPMFHTAYIFTADGDYQDKWKLFGKNHIWLPPAIRHDAVGFGQFKKEYECDVALVGSNGEGYHEDVWTYRKELVSQLKEMCERNGWTFRNPGGEKDKPDNGKIPRNSEMNNFYASSKVNIGDSLCLSKEQARYWSDRVPETTGRGGFLVMPIIRELIKIYGWTVPAYDWGDWGDLERVIHECLNNPNEREDAKKEAYNITRKNHTYVNRIETILNEVGLL